MNKASQVRFNKKKCLSLRAALTALQHTNDINKRVGG